MKLHDIYVCVNYLMLNFKRSRLHMNWIQHFEQMNVDKILCLKKKNCRTTSLLLGKKIIIRIELSVKLKNTSIWY